MAETQYKPSSSSGDETRGHYKNYNCIYLSPKGKVFRIQIHTGTAFSAEARRSIPEAPTTISCRRKMELSRHSSSRPLVPPTPCSHLLLTWSQIRFPHHNPPKLPHFFPFLHKNHHPSMTIKCHYCSKQCAGFDGADKQHCLVFKGEWPHDYGDGSYEVEFTGYKSDQNCPIGWGEQIFLHTACCNCAKAKGLDADDYVDHCCSACKDQAPLPRSTSG